MIILICKEKAMLLLGYVICLTVLPGRGILLGIMLQSTLGIASEFKMYQGFQNFPNGQFTQRGVANSSECTFTLFRK